MAFRVAEDKASATLAYLQERELVTKAYKEAVRPVDLLDGATERVQALCFLVDRSHPQYTGALSLEDQLRFVRQGHGRSGANPEYVRETVKHMHELGIRDTALEWLTERL